MANPFQNNPKFQALAPEAQQAVLQKFQSLSPEAQQIVSAKLSGVKYPLSPEVANEPGVQPASVLSDIQRASAQGLGAASTLALKPTANGLQEASGIAQGQPATSVQGKIGKVVGDAVSPAGLAMGAAAKEATTAAGPVVKAMLPGAKQEAGAAMGAAEKAAGVVQKIPTVSNLAKRFGLQPGEKGFADVVNKMSERMASGDKIPAQDLVDFRALSDHMIKTGKVALDSRVGALVSQATSKAGNLLNETVPGRAALAAEYARVAKIQNVLAKLAKGAGVGAVTAATGYGIKSFLKGH